MTKKSIGSSPMWPWIGSRMKPSFVGFEVRGSSASYHSSWRLLRTFVRSNSQTLNPKKIITQTGILHFRSRVQKLNNWPLNAKDIESAERLTRPPPPHPPPNEPRTTIQTP